MCFRGIYGALHQKSGSCQDLADRGRLLDTGAKVLQNLQPESPGQHSLDDSLGGLQLKALVALLASARTFGVELRMDVTFSLAALKPAPHDT